jgi:opacity protein-like surface antigen
MCRDMKRRLTLVAVAVAVSWLAAAAGAQTEAPAAPPPEPTAGVPVLAGYARNAWLVSQFHVGVPLLLDTDRDVVRPGANLGGRFSVANRYFGGGIHGSFQWIPIEGGRAVAPVIQAPERMPLRRATFGPFVSAEIPSPATFTPYLHAGFDFNFWNYDDNALVCDFWQCTSSNVYRFTPGLHGRLAGKIELARRAKVFLDLGLEAGVSFPGSFFSETQAWITPYLGFGAAN